MPEYRVTVTTHFNGVEAADEDAAREQVIAALDLPSVGSRSAITYYEVESIESEVTRG